MSACLLMWPSDLSCLSKYPLRLSACLPARLLQIGTYTLFQETYHRPTFQHMHIAGPKSGAQAPGCCPPTPSLQLSSAPLHLLSLRALAHCCTAN